jgi:phage-related minor tail protein
VQNSRILLAFTLLAGPLMFGSPAVAGQDSSQTGDPVADAARRAREQKKSAPKPKKVFTDDDVVIRPAPEPPAPANTGESKGVPTSASAAATGNGETAAIEKEDTNSEKYWRKRFAAQRRKIDDTQQELDVLQREAEKADVQYYSDPQKALKEQYTRDEINAKNDKIAAKKKELADLKRQLGEMEDELRRTGGDSGWAR